MLAISTDLLQERYDWLLYNLSFLGYLILIQISIYFSFSVCLKTYFFLNWKYREEIESKTLHLMIHAPSGCNSPS